MKMAFSNRSIKVSQKQPAISEVNNAICLAPSRVLFFGAFIFVGQCDTREHGRAIQLLASGIGEGPAPNLSGRVDSRPRQSNCVVPKSFQRP